MAVDYFMHEKIWFEKYKYDDAERRYYEQMNGPVSSSSHQQVMLVLRWGLAEAWSFKNGAGKRPRSTWMCALLCSFHSGCCFFQV